MQLKSDTPLTVSSQDKGKPLRILLVDDDASMLVLLPKILARRGFEVVVAGDADAAERALEAGPVDVLVADVQLPGRDGLSLAMSVQKRWPTVRIIFVSAFDVDALRKRAEVLGVTAFLSKPIGVEELIGHLVK